MHFSGYIIGITPGRDEDNKNYRMRIKVADWDPKCRSLIR